MLQAGGNMCRVEQGQFDRSSMWPWPCTHSPSPHPVTPGASGMNQEWTRSGAAILRTFQKLSETSHPSASASLSLCHPPQQLERLREALLGPTGRVDTTGFTFIIYKHTEGHAYRSRRKVKVNVKKTYRRDKHDVNSEMHNQNPLLPPHPPQKKPVAV